jgi:hypothetical protein
LSTREASASGFLMTTFDKVRGRWFRDQYARAMLAETCEASGASAASRPKTGAV